jgi:hypothetical protein
MYGFDIEGVRRGGGGSLSLRPNEVYTPPLKEGGGCNHHSFIMEFKNFNEV